MNIHTREGKHTGLMKLPTMWNAQENHLAKTSANRKIKIILKELQV